MNIVGKVLSHFINDGEVIESRKYGNGHINDTYIVSVKFPELEKIFILQRINTNVFKNPELLMRNFVSVTEYLAELIKRNGGDSERETLNVIKTICGENYYTDDDGMAWRLLNYIKDSVCYDKVESPEQFYKSAVTFGNFQYMLRDYPAETLGETIPNFHNTEDRFKKLMQAVAEDKCGRLASVLPEVEFAKQREEFCSIFEREHKAGRLPLRVTHNDTKLNNILFDKHTKAPICIVDLDTIMPGYAVNDFGDAIRFGATTAREDETDLSLVNFDIALYELYVKGFIEGINGGLTDFEIQMLPFSAIMMTLECGIRFLTDYLSGDTYFKISREGHNLDRARNQFKLVSDMEKHFDEMKKIVNKYSQK